MRILLISHTCQSRSEGQPKAEQLARLKGIELKVLVPDRWFHYGSWRSAELPVDSAFEFEAGAVALPWAGPAQFYLHWYRQLARILIEFRPDVIDLWEEPWGLVSAHAIWLRNRLLPEAKVVSETEQNIYKSLPPPFRWFCAYSLRHADFCIARSREAATVLQARGFMGAAEVVPNAVDADLFRPLDRQKCREELGLTGFVAGYFGRLVEEKGVSDILEAVRDCPENVNVIFVGSGPCQAALESQAKEAGLNGRIRFLASRPLAQLPSIMNAVDCVVLPSRTTARWKEQFGRVLIEAHACGTPVIGSDSGAIPDVVGDGGRIVPEKNPKALAAAITRLSANAELCALLGKAGREQVLQRYTWEKVARQMYSIYERVCSS